MSNICKTCRIGMSLYDVNSTDTVCSSCQLETLKADFKESITKISAVGHNLDCMFCGFKDRFVKEALEVINGN